MGWLPLLVLIFLLVWAAAPGRAPAYLEEALLAPFTWALGYAWTCAGGGAPAPSGPADEEREEWAALQTFEARSTRPPDPAAGISADVLARAGPARRRDMLLLSVPYTPGKVEVGDPCVVGRVLVGFVDGPPPRRRAGSLLARFGLGGAERLPENAWVRLLHSTGAPWPEPLRLEVRLCEEASEASLAGAIRAIVGPVREEDPLPLRLLHPTSLERPRPGLEVRAWEGAGPLARIPVGCGFLVGSVAHSAERPEACFVQPRLDPNAIHRVYVLSRGLGDSALDSSGPGPLGRGVAIPARVAPVPDAEHGGATLLVLAGSSSGVRPGAAVVRGWALVGVTTAVGPWHSRAATPEDPTFRMRVLVARPSGPDTPEIETLLRGEVRARRGGGLAWWPDRDGGPLIAGDRIWSAPGGLDLPKGLLLGRVAAPGPPDRPQAFELQRPAGAGGRPAWVGVFRFADRSRSEGAP